MYRTQNLTYAILMTWIIIVCIMLWKDCNYLSKRNKTEGFIKVYKVVIQIVHSLENFAVLNE